MDQVLVFINTTEIGGILRLKNGVLIANKKLCRHAPFYVDKLEKALKANVDCVVLDDIKFTFKYLED